MKRLLLAALFVSIAFAAPASAQTAPAPYSSTSPRPAGAPVAQVALAYPCPVRMDDAMLMILGQIAQSYVSDDDYAREWDFWESASAPGATQAQRWSVAGAGWSSVAWDQCNDHARWIYYRTRAGYYLFTLFRVKPDTAGYWRDYVSDRQTP